MKDSAIDAGQPSDLSAVALAKAETFFPAVARAKEGIEQRSAYPRGEMCQVPFVLAAAPWQATLLTRSCQGLIKEGCQKSPMLVEVCDDAWTDWTIGGNLLPCDCGGAGWHGAGLGGHSGVSRGGSGLSGPDRWGRIISGSLAAASYIQTTGLSFQKTE